MINDAWYKLRFSTRDASDDQTHEQDHLLYGNNVGNNYIWSLSYYFLRCARHKLHHWPKMSCGDKIKVQAM
jgi:hypothetical protein